MAFTPGGDDGAMNGTTAVTLVSAPASGAQRIIKTLTIQNRDTVVNTITLRKVSGGGTRQLWSGDLDVGDTLIFDDPLVLDDTSSSVTAVMAGAVTTTNPDWTSSWADVS